MKNFLLAAIVFILTLSLGFAAGYLWPIQTNDDVYTLLDNAAIDEVGETLQPVQFWTEDDVTNVYTNMHRRRYVDSVFLETDHQTILNVSRVLLRDSVPITPEMIVTEYDNHRSIYNGIRKVPIRDTIIVYKALETDTSLHKPTSNSK